jgi:hypothetical protein
MTTTTRSFPAYANRIGYGDINPHEIVRVISNKCIEVRSMDAERDKSVELTWAAGGFAGHCVNQNEQKWVITSNDSYPVERVRLHKDGRWYGVGKQRFTLSDNPVKFYDFNF